VPDARSGLALYCTPTCSEERIDALETALASVRLKRRLPRAVGEPVRSMGLLMTDDFGRPDLPTLGGLADGLSEEAASTLAESQEVLVLSFAAPIERITELNALVYPLFAELAQGGGVVEELGTGRLFDADAFSEHSARVTAEPLDTSAFFVLEATGDEGDAYTDLETIGLRALGLHDMRMQDLREDEIEAHTALLNALAQLAWEQGGLQERSFVSESALELTAARHRAVGIEGTAYALASGSLWSTSADPIVLIGFDGRFDAPPADPLSSYPSALVFEDEPEAPAEATEPEMPAEASEPETPAETAESETPAETAESETPAETAEPAEATSPAPPEGPASLEEAQQQARAKLELTVRERWDAGLPSGDRLYLKVPFDGPEGRVEYLWVQLVSWRGGAMDGVLRSTPAWTDDLAEGDAVNFEQAEVFDYLLRHKDGTTEGNTTERFLAH
jgi:uncharacterized protein YegJ (DUF2314 family)